MNRATLVYQCHRDQQKRIKDLNEQNRIYADANLPLLDIEDAKQKVLDLHIQKWKELCIINDHLSETLMEHKGYTKTNWFFITVRPRPDTTFKDFIRYIDKFIHRKCITNYKLSLEQKCVEGSGEGFHMHAVVDATWKSFREALRDTSSSFNKCADENCVEIKTTRNPHELFTNYCIEYTSKDNHKESTQHGDALWREKYNIEDYYYSGGKPFCALPIKSNWAVQESVKPFIVEMT